MEQPRKTVTKLTPIKNGRGEITGWLRVFWSESMQVWVSIPGSEL